MLKEEKNLKQVLAPGNSDVKAFARRAARSSTGSRIKVLRVTCYPGVTQLDGEDDKMYSMKDYKKEKGDYQVIADVASIDASMTGDVISYGLVFYGRRLGKSVTIERPPLEFPEKDAPEIAEAIGEIDEKEVLSNLKKEKKPKERKRKESGDFIANSYKKVKQETSD